MGEGVFEQWSEGRGEESWTITDLPLGQDVARQTADASIRVLAELNNQAHTRERSREVERERSRERSREVERGRERDAPRHGQEAMQRKEALQREQARTGERTHKKHSGGHAPCGWRQCGQSS